MDVVSPAMKASPAGTLSTSYTAAGSVTSTICTLRFGTSSTEVITKKTASQCRNTVGLRDLTKLNITPSTPNNPTMRFSVSYVSLPMTVTTPLNTCRHMSPP